MNEFISYKEFLSILARFKLIRVDGYPVNKIDLRSNLSILYRFKKEDLNVIFTDRYFHYKNLIIVSCLGPSILGLPAIIKYE